ncbi:transcriptional regulator of RNA polII, SAGA, subunit-domain-containing protein [Mycena floridula]|nr:transcriptional regulator of RNA polII, SAGA, subunit-domain-containing protein [Mycena floridula]
MSLSSTTTIKQQLTSHLGPKSETYFQTLRLFFTGKISRQEFEDALKPVLDAPHLFQLHNALVISLFDARSFKRPPTPPVEVPKPPPRKRRRVLPYQGPDVPDEALGLRSSKIKRWVVSLGKNERERVRNLRALPIAPRRDLDEISSERGVTLLSERGDPAGSRLAVQLASVTRAPTVQHISDRVNLICAQHNMSAPSRSVPPLINLATEVKLKQLITHALTLTSSSLAISSINPSSSHPHSQKILSTAAFETLFTVGAADLPNKSAAAMRLALGERDVDEEDHDIALLKDREVRDPRWQIVALLGERSSVKEALKNRSQLL